MIPNEFIIDWFEDGPPPTYRSCCDDMEADVEKGFATSDDDFPRKTFCIGLRSIYGADLGEVPIKYHPFCGALIRINTAGNRN